MTRTTSRTWQTPVFSLHAVAGVPVGNPILLRVSLGAATLVALVDTGSTHNFIGEAAAHRTGLSIQPRPRLTMTVANREKVACPSVLRQAPISIEGMAFDVDLYVMPLAGYDMVLGTQWMAALGHIAWDVATHTLSF
jgi:predicted aspartyl protease